MEQTGRIFTGNNSKIGFRDWAFGQFSKVTIRTAVLLLKKSDVDIVAHGNATKVPRALSAMVSTLKKHSITHSVITWQMP